MKPIRFLICLIALSPAVLAGTATFSPVADTTISENNAASTTGTSDTMIVGHLDPGHANVPSRGLLRFDLSSLPSGVVVTSATVELTVTAAADSSPHTHLLHRVTLGWTEAAATWINSGGDFWENAGGDYDPAPDASVPITGGATYLLTSTAGLINTVQTWATNADLNFGWVLRSAVEDAGRSGRRFSTREAIANGPKLVVGYFVPPPPVTLKNARAGGASFSFEFTALPGSSYTVQFKPIVDAGAWTTLITHPAPPSPTVISVQDALTPTNRFYRVVSP